MISRNSGKLTRLLGDEFLSWDLILQIAIISEQFFGYLVPIIHGVKARKHHFIPKSHERINLLARKYLFCMCLYALICLMQRIMALGKTVWTVLLSPARGLMPQHLAINSSFCFSFTCALFDSTTFSTFQYLFSFNRISYRQCRFLKVTHSSLSSCIRRFYQKVLMQFWNHHHQSLYGW